MTTTPVKITTFAEAEVNLAAAMPNYQHREPQQRLAAFVEEVIAAEGHGLAEAGTGTGKSIATLIPSILSGKKTIICTATKALMDQYSQKDLPMLEENLGVPFAWASLKGRGNYLCMAKAMDSQELEKAPNGYAILTEVTDDEDHDGDMDHFVAEVTDRDRWALTISSADCTRSECPFYEQCFAQKAKAKALASQVVVTNHMMMLTELALTQVVGTKGIMLGDYDLVMFDEAHELEDWATKALRADIKERGLTMLASEVNTFAQRYGDRIDSADEIISLQKEAWAPLPKDGTRLVQNWFVQNAEPFMSLIEVLRETAIQIENIDVVGDKKAKFSRDRLVTRCVNEARDLENALLTSDDLMVRWVEEVPDRRTRQVYTNIVTAPVSVGDYLKQWLWDETPSVLLSATLSVAGNFDYIRKTLGLPAETQEMSVGTPFDYTTQAMTFVPPPSAPSPKERSSWLAYANAVTMDLIEASSGGALLLFTSRSAMEEAYRNLSPLLDGRGINSMYQGQRPNPVLAADFAADTHSVLFAMKSFMTGVDFQGETCRLVILDKLPFPVPTEPVFAARADRIKRRGGSDFGELTIPAMSLTLQQAYGRLIRTHADKGVVAILDSRLSATGYGKGIVRSLPNAPVVTDVARVREFYS